MRDKPLYRWNGKTSSSVRELMAAGAPRRLSLKGLHACLAYGCVYAPWTLIDGIECVPDDFRPDFTVKEWSAADAQVAVTAAFDRAVERVAENGNRAAFLSGGIDSSAIVASLRRRFPETEIRTYCVIHEDPATDEREWARKVAEANGTKHTELLLTGDMVARELKRMLADYDQPSLDGVNFWFACRLLREAGETSVISGEGGDELFAGYGAFAKARQLFAAAKWTRLLPSVFAAPLGRLVERFAPDERFRKLGQLFGWRGDPYYLSRRVFSDRMIASLLKREFRDCPDWFVAVEPAPSGSDLLNRCSWLEVETSLKSMYLRDGYQTSLPHGVEVSSPFLDDGLISLLFSIPGALKVDPRLPKPLLVRAAGAGLPEECVIRRKQGFTLPFDRYFASGLKTELENFFLGGESRLFDSAALARIWKAYKSGRVYWSRVWTLFVIERWCAENGVEI